MVCYALDAVNQAKNITQDPKLDGDAINRQRGRTTVSVNLRGPTAFFDRDLQEILTRVEQKCGAKSSKPKGFEAAAAAEAARLTEEQGADAIAAGTVGALEEGQRQIDANNVLWQSVLEWTLILIGLLTAFNRVARFVPFAPLRLVAAPLPLVIRRAAGFQGAIIARKAANDLAWARLERAIQLAKAA